MPPPISHATIWTIGYHRLSNEVEQYLHDAAEGATRILQNSLQVLAYSCRLVGDTAFDEVA